MKRDLTKPKVKEKIIKLPISKFIDSKFRDYAIYVLESRGIPSFYDALTPVQRYILKNLPTSFNKSLTVVGKCIQDGYHHGDCLDYDTKINLADGTQITIGKWFEEYPEAILLVKSINENNQEVIGIELENGEIIKCTKNHPFYVNGKWIKAENLQENDDIHTLS